MSVYFRIQLVDAYYNKKLNKKKKITIYFCLPPSVADNRKCVPYFLIRLSVIACVVGLRPRSRIFLMNSGVSGNWDSRKSLLSTAKLFTFHLPNSLLRINKNRQKNDLKNNTWIIICISIKYTENVTRQKINENQNALLWNPFFMYLLLLLFIHALALPLTYCFKILKKVKS